MRQSTLSFLIVWHLLAAALIALLPSLAVGFNFWTVPGPDWALAIELALAYLVAALALTVMFYRRGQVSWNAVAAITLSAIAIALIYFLVSRKTVGLTRSALLGMCVAAVVLPLLGFGLRRMRGLALAALAIALCGAIAINVYRQHRAHHRTVVQSTETFVTSALYELRVVDYADVVPRTDVWGGGLAHLGDDYLLATGDGRLYVLTLNSAKRSLVARLLPYHVPLNREEFEKSVHTIPAGVEVHSEAADRVHAVQTWQFRVADVLTDESDGRLRVFVSHHFWNGKQRCFGARVSEMDTTREALLVGAPGLAWKTIFEATPCLPLEGPDAVHGNNPFEGMEIGGRLQLRDAHTLMLSLGDHDFTGLETKWILAQDPNSSYGKTLLLHLDDGSSEVYSLGHRNPQGLYVQPDGTIWETEHGPQGGDELNLIQKGRNYGWPLVTYGTDYGEFGWPLSHQQGRHEGYEKPTFAWVPSVGTSNLIRIERQRFPLWKGDLLVATLHGHALFRMRLEDQRVVYAEPIAIDQRLRDIIEGKDGTLLMWTDHSDIVTIEPASGAGGAVLFASKCGGCHKTVDGETHTYGPDLWGIVGRRVARARGYDAYSAGMKAMGGVWSAERLDQFLRNPQATVPGTTMTYAGVSDPAERAAIVQYLKGRK